MKRRIAIIPARGGSKRILDKNIMDFLGRPLLAWTVAAAKESGCFDRIVVSTDDARIADVARDNGVEVPFLRDRAADDFASCSQATHRALEQTLEHFGEEFETVVQLMPNCPLRDAATIRDSIVHFDLNAALYQLSCCRFGWMNPWWAFTLAKTGEPAPLFPAEAAERSQDLPPLFFPTGAVWIANVRSFLASRDFYSAGHSFFEIPWYRGVDIDDWEDFRMAEVAARTLGLLSLGGHSA